MSSRDQYAVDINGLRRNLPLFEVAAVFTEGDPAGDEVVALGHLPLFHAG